MGMGEPLLNFDAVRHAVEMITSEEGMAMSPRRITISTVGIPDGIRRMAEELPAVHLAVSLHTVNNHLRSNLIPVNQKHSLDDIKEALIGYHRITGNRFSIEYLMLEGVNDSRRAALELAGWCRSFPVKINLIPYNRTEQDYKNSRSTEMFRDTLAEKNMVVNIRRSRGSDIDAACGQLVSRK
jgi:23S rRNA (adenine2503-C2)-methyltransferase